MGIILDLTNKFNTAVDSTCMHGPCSYIDIGLTDSLCESFSFSLHNFILNLDAEIIEAIIPLQKKKSEQKLHEDGFFIVNSAKFFFDNIKGADAQFVYYKENDIVNETYQTWKYQLDENDRIYEIIGFLKHQSKVMCYMYAVTSLPKVTMILSENDLEYIEDNKSFLERTHELNNYYRNTFLKPKGQLFDRKFFDQHVESINDFSEYVVKKKS